MLNTARIRAADDAHTFSMAWAHHDRRHRMRMRMRHRSADHATMRAQYGADA